MSNTRVLLTVALVIVVAFFGFCGFVSLLWLIAART
jgi:hypothetical protein